MENQSDVKCEYLVLQQEFDKDEDKDEILTKPKDERRDKDRSKTSEDGDRRRRSRDPDVRTQTSRSTSPLKQVPCDVFVYFVQYCENIFAPLLSLVFRYMSH